MPAQHKTLKRLLSVTRQRSRLADAACLAARKQWNAATRRREQLEESAGTLTTEFGRLIGSVHAGDRLKSFHAVMEGLQQTIMEASEEVRNSQRRFDEAAATCASLRREIDVLENLISLKQAAWKREQARREDRRSDERFLQRQHLASTENRTATSARG